MPQSLMFCGFCFLTDMIKLYHYKTFFGKVHTTEMYFTSCFVIKWFSRVILAYDLLPLESAVTEWL